MAITQLASIDILNLLVSHGIAEDKKSEYLYGYMEAFMGYLSDQVAGQLSDDDEQAIQSLLQDPTLTPEKIEEFYRKRIPHYDSFLLAGTLTFKKAFLLEYYRGMLEEMVKGKHASVPLWIQLIATAEEDKWNSVAALIAQIEETYAKTVIATS